MAPKRPRPRAAGCATAALWAFGTALLPVGLAQAQEAAFLPEAAHSDWTAIGRLNVTGFNRRAMCTATLIAPDRVLSAAHCVLGPDGAPIDVARFRFVPGWFRGTHAGVAEVAHIWVPPEVLADGLRVGRDVAILQLTAPLSGIAPLPLAQPAPDQVRIIGYRWDRPHALSDTGPCLTGRVATRVLWMRCPATFGNSGGPVLQDQGGDWRVVGVVSAITEAGQTLAAPLPEAAFAR